jgi:transposase
VHHRYAPEGQTINKEYSCNWQLHRDNAPAHSSHLIQSFLAKHGISVVRQAPYSPDMAPCDFWLFPKLKGPLKGSRFDSREDIMQNVKELRSLPELLPAVEGSLD